MASKQPPQAARKVGSKSSQLALWLSIAFVTLIIMSLPTVVILFFGMLPTIVAFIIDRSKQRNASSCVGGINFCGVFPFLMELWSGDNSMDMSVRILTDVFSLAIMFGAAAFGWMIYLTLSPVIAAFLSVRAQHKISSMRTTQRQLIEEWGEDVATPQEVLDMREEVESGIGMDADTEPFPDELNVNDFLEGIDSILESNSNTTGSEATSEDENSAEKIETTELPPRSASAGG